VKRTIAIVATFLLLFCIPGCSFDFASVESLMRAPKLTGESAEIERAFESAVGTSVSLLSPRSGEFRTAFVLYDYDADGSEEAIAFYTDNATAHIHFLDYVNGEWISCDDEIGSENEVYELLFRDLNNDGIVEIIVNFNSKHSNRTMSVYSVSPPKQDTLLQIQLMSTVQYSSYVCLDMDLDGIVEILYTVLEVSVDTGNSIPFVRVLKYMNDPLGGRIDVVASLPLYGGITAISALAADSTAEQVRVYIDCLYHDAKTMITEVVTWNAENGYVLLLHKHESASLLKTTRMFSLYTADLDKDGLMEIPGEYEMPASEFSNVAEGLIPVAIGRNYYHCLNDGALALFKAEFHDPSGRYIMDLLQLGYYGRLSISYDFVSEETGFYLYDSVQSERGEHLFTLSLNEINGGKGVSFDISSTATALGLTPDFIRSAMTMIETEVN